MAKSNKKQNLIQLSASELLQLTTSQVLLPSHWTLVVVNVAGNIVGICSPSMPQISRGKLPKLYIQCFDQCGLLQVYRNGMQAYFL